MATLTHGERGIAGTPSGVDIHEPYPHAPDKSGEMVDRLINRCGSDTKKPAVTKPEVGSHLDHHDSETNRLAELAEINKQLEVLSVARLQVILGGVNSDNLVEADVKGSEFYGSEEHRQEVLAEIHETLTSLSLSELIDLRVALIKDRFDGDYYGSLVAKGLAS